jgi:hypothetical protein
MPAAVIVVITKLLTIFTRRIAAHKRFRYAGIALFVIWIFLIIAGLAKYSASMSYPMSVLLQPSAKTQTTVGQVTAIRQADVFPMYYCPNTRTLQKAKFITVNGNEYYIISCAPEIGQYVKINCITEEHVVISWEISTLNEDDENQQTNVSNSDGIANEILVCLGRKLIKISIGLFIFVVSVQYVLGRRFNDYLIRRDRLYQAGACPNRWGLLLNIILFLPIIGILISWGLSGFSGAYIIAFLGAATLLQITAKKQTTYLTLEENELLVLESGSVRHYPYDSITLVRWGKSKLPFNRSLIVEFCNGFNLMLEQEHFWGLEYLYRKLNSYLKQ